MQSSTRKTKRKPRKTTHNKTELLFYHAIKYYNFNMDVVIKFSKSAFKHKVTEADICMAFDKVLYDERLDESDGEVTNA